MVAGLDVVNRPLLTLLILEKLDEVDEEDVDLEDEDEEVGGCNEPPFTFVF